MGAGASFIEVEELTEALEQDFARVVPRTPRGSIDVATCDRGKVRQVVDGANERIKERYVAGWQSYTARKGAAVDELREACAALVEDFHDAEPRCALPANTPSALVDMASRHGAALHAALERLVTKAGGEYVHGPTKKVERIKDKAENDYQGDVARVLDVERATGLFDSLEALNTAASAFRGTINGLTVRRCKDAFFAHKHDSGYRDMKLFVEVEDTGFIGELQLNLRQIQNIKGHAHKVYDVERVLEKGTDEALRRAIDGLDLESEQVLCLAANDGQSILDACGHVVVLEDALDEALPAGCEVANVYDAGGAVHAHVRLGIADVGALARLRDAVLFEGSFETAINAALPHDASQLAEKLATSDKMKELGFSASVSQSGRCLLKNERFLVGDSESSLGAPPETKIRVESIDVHVDRGAFMECYARIMMRFAKLTMHQREKLTEVRGAKVAVLLAPAGGGKTFVAVQRVVQVLNEDPDAMVLFVARNKALALFFCKWLVVASRKSVEHVVERVHVLVAPFSSGQRCVRVEALGGRRRLVLDETRADATTYALIVTDEAHHLVGDASLRSELAELGGAEASLLFLGDASQASAAMRIPEEIARSLVELPQEDVVVATLSEVVRSTKRIVAGAAAFQLAAGRKAETSTHGASVGPPLVARVFTLSEGDDAGETYAREVVEALAAIRRQLVDLEDLDDRVAVVGPDEAFIEKLREPLARALGEFELVDAATASAVLPRGDTEARAADAKQLLVVDSVDNMDGLERLVVICVGLDQVIDDSSGVLETRSRLYRAMTRAQLAVAVVNEVLPGGWLEFLGCVELDADGGFDDAAERENRAETAADDVVGAVVEETSAPVATRGDATAVSKASSAPARGSDGAQQASPNDDADAPVAEKAVTDAEFATTPSEAEPMKVLQSIWDASAVATASRGDLRFMPFSESVDLSKLAELRTLKGHSSLVRSVVVSPDGRRIFSASHSPENTLKVWEVATGECVATLKGHSGRVNCVAMFPDGRRIVSASDDKTLKVWDVETGECVATLEGHSGFGVQYVAVFPDGRRVVSASSDNTLKVWDVKTGECVSTLQGHFGDVNCVAVSPDGRRVVSGSLDNTLKVWDVATGECVATLEGHSDEVMGVAVFPDGRRVVSASDDETLKVWDMATGKCVATLEGHLAGVVCVAVSPDGRRVVSGSRDNRLKVWDIATGKCVATLEGHSKDINGVAVFPDGRRVVSASDDKTLKVWGVEPVSVDLSKLAELRTLNGHSSCVYGTAVFPDGRRVFSGSHDKTLKVWDAETGECVATLKGHSSGVRCVAVFPDGRRVVSGCDDIKVWDVETGKCVATLEGHSDGVMCVAVFPDGRRVLSASWDKTLKVWDVATGECVATLEGHSEKVTSVAVFLDGRRVVSGSSDNTLNVWNVATGECVATLGGHSDVVECVAVSPDRRRVVSGSQDKTLKVWDVATGKCVATLERHSSYVFGVAVSPDGRHVVSASHDRTLKFWGVPKS